MSTTKRVKLPRVTNAFEAIVESIHKVDIHAEFIYLRDALKVGDTRNDYGSLRVALDNAEDNARRAHQLYLSARVEVARYEAETAAVLSAMRTEAIYRLQVEKNDGVRTKAITDSDVTSRCAEDHPDEWKAQSERKTKVENVLKHMEKLSDLWTSRCRTLQTLISTVRR